MQVSNLKEQKLKILMATMDMDIGGAETHVLELCKSLSKKGIELYVVSNGGEYEAELKENGIKHFSAPLHNKNISNMIKSYQIIKKIILDNDIKLVHAHARIPAFLCGLLKKRLKFKFATTVHGIYNTAFLYRILTNWGEKTLAVSEDLKQYLIKNYQIPLSDIYMTVNGIDTDKFSKNVDCSELYDEFCLQKDSKKILNLSRMDADMTSPTFALIDCAYELNTKYGNVEIIIVGKGDDLENVKKRANQENDRIGKKIIHIAGGRTDANRFFSIADIFVGVSRSALEAMSASVPVVLAGNQGYIGIFNESTVKAGIDTNFCCRGFKSVTKELVYNDLITLLEMDNQSKESLGKFGRNIVLENYSVDKMADDAISMYDKMRKPCKKMDIMISGYYGSNNHGDDALLKAITDDLRSLVPDIKITVLSRRPSETRAIYNVDSIHRFQFIKIRKVLKETNLLLLGGGTLVQDLTSSQSLFYYLTIIKMAIKNDAQVMLYANGIGPVSRPKNREMAAKTLDKVDLITLRDDASLDVLKELGVKNKNICLTADAAFGIKNTDIEKGLQTLQKLGLNGKKFFCVAVRSWKYLKPSFERDIAKFIDYVCEKYGYEVLFIPMQKSSDLDISRRIGSSIKNHGYIIDGEFSMNEILGIVKNAEFVLGMRLHTIIYAAKMGTPIIGLVYDPKVQGMMNIFGQRYYTDVSDFSVDTLKNYADEVIEKKVEISKKLKSDSDILEKKAFSNAEYAFELLNRNIF